MNHIIQAIKFILIAVSFVVPANMVEAQQVIASAGNYHMHSFGSISYTVINEETGEKGWKDTETLGVAYDQLIPVLIRAIQAQNTMMESLHQRISQRDYTAKE